MRAATNRLETATRNRACLAAALVALGGACGTLGAPSTGDEDLPTSFVGAFSPLGPGQQPGSSRVLIAADDPTTSLESPSAIVLAGGVQFVYATLTPRGMPPSIALATERAGLAGSLLFDPPQVLLSAQLAWEGTGVSDPAVTSDGDGGLVMVYAAAGSIGLARSADGRTFTRNPAPILQPDASRGEGTSLDGPAVARDPGSGAWWLAYASGGSLFAAQATTPDGPWTRVGHPIVTPTTGVAPDAGTAFESVALGDPSLSIYTTTAGRSMFVAFFTGAGPTAFDVVGAAASFDGQSFTPLGRAVYSEPMRSIHAGSFEQLSDRTALLWFSTASGSQRVVSAALGPAIPRVATSQPR